MALSDYLAPSLQIGSTILSAGSELARGTAMRTIGRRRAAAGEFEAQQLEQEAVAARGLGMRAAQDEILKSENVKSAAMAKAAASGAGASDPTVMAIIARTAGEGAYRSAVAMYEGEAQARLDVMRAAAARFEGAQSQQDAAAAANLSQMGAAATVLSGGVKALSMFEKYFPQDMVKKDTDKMTTMPAASGAWLDTGSDLGDFD